MARQYWARVNDADPEVAAMTALASRAEFRRGWRTLVASFVGIAFSLVPLGGVYTVGVLVGPLTAEFGWQRHDVMLIPMLLYIGLTPSAFLVGWIADRFGVRKIALFSISMLAAMFVALAVFTHGNLPMFLGTYLLMGVLGAGAGPIPYTRSTIERFRQSRGLALGLVLAGTGLSGMLIPAYTSWLVAWHGWRAAYLGLAALPALITLPAVYFLLQEVPAGATAGTHHGPRPGVSFVDGVKSYRFWVMVIAFSTITAIVTGVIANLVPMLTDAGYDIGRAVWMVSVLGASTLAGRVIVGFFLDRYWAPAVAMCVLIPASLACVLLMKLDLGVAATVAAIALFGATNGAEFDILIYMLTRYFGQRSYGLLFASMLGVQNVVGALGPAVFGYNYDVAGNYRTGLSVSALALLACALLLMTLRRYPRSFEDAQPRLP